MSNVHLSAAWERSRAKGVVLTVLLSIADRADASGRAWCGALDIMERTNARRGTVFDAIRKLRSMGEIEVQDGHGPGGCNVYSVEPLLRLSRKEKRTSRRKRTSQENGPHQSEKRDAGGIENRTTGRKEKRTQTLLNPPEPPMNPPPQDEDEEFLGWCEKEGISRDDGLRVIAHDRVGKIKSSRRGYAKECQRRGEFPEVRLTTRSKAPSRPSRMALLRASAREQTDKWAAFMGQYPGKEDMHPDDVPDDVIERFNTEQNVSVEGIRLL